MPSDVQQKFVDGNGDGAPDTFVVTWRNLGHYEKSFDRRNTLQVAISDGTNPAMGLGNNVCFSYDVVCWSTGNFDGGIGGFGSVPGVAGVNQGDGVHSFQIGRFNQDGGAYDGPGGAPGGVHFLDGRTFCFNAAASDGNVCPIPLDGPGGFSVALEPGESLARSLRYVSPETGQTATVSVDDPSGAQGAGLVVATTPGNPAVVSLEWTPTCDSLGTYPLVVLASDDAPVPCKTDTGIRIVVTCDDGDPSTDDACDPGTGCTHEGGSCDDDNACTDDSRDPSGACVHVPNGASCDDGNPCTDDSCDPDKGCVHDDNRASCDDGSACTTHDRCERGRCVGGRPARCDDHDACTRDACDPATGCVHAVADDDGDGVCNRRDICPDSIRTATVVVGACDSGVPNALVPFGCTIADLLEFCEERRGCARSQVSRCVDQTLDVLRFLGVIDRSQARAIERCYRQRG